MRVLAHGRALGHRLDHGRAEVLRMRAREADPLDPVDGVDRRAAAPPNSVRTSGSRSRPQELTFWPSSVTSRTPSAARRVTSATISPGRRLCSRPRTAGTMQYEQTELQPIEICTHAWKARSRRAGRSPAKCRHSAKRPRVDAQAAGADPVGEMRDRAWAEGDVDVRVELEDPLALRLRVAAADGDHALGVGSLQRRRLREMGGEALVGLLAHRAGVEDDHVGLLLRDRLAQPERLEQALDPLRVVGVHLAPECGDVVALHGQIVARS